MNKIGRLLLYFSLFLIPLLFLPVTRDFFAFNKNFFLFALALLLFAGFLVKTILKRQFSLQFNKLDLFVFLFAGINLIATLLTRNRLEAFILPGQTGTIFALTLIYFLLRQFWHNDNSKLNLTKPFTFAGLVLSLLVMIQATGLTAKLPLPQIYQLRTFTPAGSLLILASYLLLVLVILIADFLEDQPQQGGKLKLPRPIQLIPFLIIFAGLVTSSALMFIPKNRPLLLPFSTGWQISIDSLKNPKTALLGVGPGNFVNAFSRFKPASFNNLPKLWAYRFTASSNYYFQLFSEIGLLGLASFFLLLYKLWQFLKKEKSPLPLGLLAIVILLALMPQNILIMLLFYILLAKQALPKQNFGKWQYPKTHVLSLNYDVALRQKLLLFLTLPGFLVVFLLFYLVGRAYYAEMLITDTLVNSQKKTGQQVYDAQTKAIKLNPYFSDYRVIFSQTNLILANAIARNLQKNPKAETATKDRQNLAQLVTQAIDNGKLALSYNPSTANWENLASIYRALINAANDAEKWALSALGQAVLSDPVNPLLRVSLAGLMQSLGNLDEAERQLEIAVSLKPDFANAWYNLGNVEKDLHLTEKAKSSYEKALSLVVKDSSDYKHIEEQISALTGKKQPADAKPGNLEVLSSPADEATPPAEVKPPLELQEGLAPAGSLLTPSPVVSSPTESPL